MQSPDVRQFAPLELEARPTVGTDAAAYYLNRKKQTLIKWACVGGALSPVRVNGRLHWNTADIRRLLGVS